LAASDACLFLGKTDGRRQIKAIMLKYNYFSNRFPVIFLVRPGSGRKHNVKKRKVIKIINTTQIV